MPPGLEEEVAGWLSRNAGVVECLAGDQEAEAILRKVLAASPYAAECLEKYPALLAELHAAGRLARPAEPDEVGQLFAALTAEQPTETEINASLRKLRHRELVRIIWRDLAGQADFIETLADLSAVADAAICAALAWSQAQLEAKFGTPRTADGDVAEPVVLGMGKLGGRELNFSSDVDLIFCFTEHGETDGERSKSNEEFFRLLVQRVIGVLSKNTSDGFVYRVDIRLRPFGESGPVAVSLPALETYLAQHGRDWERYAYVKARVINPWAGTKDFYDQMLRPFVYRRYLDYGVFSSLREMKLMIEAEVKRKELRDNVKLGSGGIREVEFVVQTLQLIRGGNIASIRERSLLRAMNALVEYEYLPADSAAELREAYGYLRLFENRLQAIADRQTHDVPEDELNRGRLTLAMGETSWQQVAETLAGFRATIARHFGRIVFHSDEEPELSEDDEEIVALFRPDAPLDTSIELLGKLGYEEPRAALDKLHAFRDSGFNLRLDEAGRQRLITMMPDVVKTVAGQAEQIIALTGMLTIIEAIGRRSAYFSLLNENPEALERLVSLCSMSNMLVTQMATHPLLLDELLDPRVFQAPPTREDLEDDLTHRLREDMLDDPEASRDALRNFQQAAIFRVTVTDLSGALPLMKVSDRLTDIAEIVLTGALQIARYELSQRHGRPTCVVDGNLREARFAIVGYGKLGGLELGYGSDLDIIFLHDSEGSAQQTNGEKPLENSVYFVRLAQRIIHILTMLTSSGSMYEVDTRLRPNGKSGLLVTSLAAFVQYQHKEAWTWEHQALLRGRSVTGDQALRDSFESVRRQILAEQVQRDRLQQDVLDMRQKMRDQLDQSTADQFDLKQGFGGITDIEFIVQYLVLREAGNEASLTEWSDNIRQLDALAVTGILSADDAEMLAATYRAYRSRLHRLSLAGQPRLVSADEFATEASGVRNIWQQVFAADPGQS